MAWTPIVRHQQVKYNYSPFDADLEEYFDKRGGMSITDFEEGLETHHILPVVKGGTGLTKIFNWCISPTILNTTEFFPQKGIFQRHLKLPSVIKESKANGWLGRSNLSDKGMLEPYVGKPTRTVLRRERGSNPSDLADKRPRR